jgi:hypothetical protein
LQAKKGNPMVTTNAVVSVPPNALTRKGNNEPTLYCAAVAVQP